MTPAGTAHSAIVGHVVAGAEPRCLQPAAASHTAAITPRAIISP